MKTGRICLGTGVEAGLCGSGSGDCAVGLRLRGAPVGDLARLLGVEWDLGGGKLNLIELQRDRCGWQILSLTGFLGRLASAA